MIDYTLRIFVILIVCQLAACTGQQNKKIDLSQYDSSSPIEISMVENALQVVWQSADDTKFRVDFNLSGIDPLINTISFAKEENSSFIPLAKNIQPDFHTSVGTREPGPGPYTYFDKVEERPYKSSFSEIDLKKVAVESEGGKVKITFQVMQ